MKQKIVRMKTCRDAKVAYALLAPNKLKLIAVSFAFGLPELSAKISHLGCVYGKCFTSLACAEGSLPVVGPEPPAAGVGRCDCTGDGWVARCCARLCICCMCCICCKGVGVD